MPKVAIAGLGVGISGHLPAFRHEGWKVVSLSGTDKAKAEGLAKEHGVPAGYDATEYDQVLATPGLDAVVVASPPSTHPDLVLRALAAGKHVLVEKPFAVNAAEGETMRAAAAKSDRTTMIAEAYRFSPSRAFVKELLEQGYIGKLSSLVIAMTQGPRERPAATPPPLYWRTSSQTGGGFSAGPLTTLFESVMDWFGDVSSVRGSVYEQWPGGQKQPDGSPADADNSVSLNFNLAQGGWGSITASYTPFGQGVIMDFMGSDGAIRLHGAGLLPLGSDTVSGGRYDDGTDFKQLEIPDRLREKVSDASPKIEIYHAYQAVVRKMAEGVQSGNSPSPNFEDAQKLQKLTDAVKESSASSGGWVRL